MRPELLFTLAFFALQDLRHSSISLLHICLFGIPALAFALLHPHSSLPVFAAAFLPGAALYACSRLTRGGIGSGDALILLLMGFYLPVLDILLSLLAGLFLSFFYSVFLLVSGRGKNSTSFPFLPFLFFGTLLFRLLSRSF